MIIHDVDQNSPEWLKLRLGRPTASNFAKIVTPAQLKPSSSLVPYAHQLAAETYSNGLLDAWGGNADTERGNYLEEEAVNAYEIINGLTTEKVGFVTDDQGLYGCSPDRLVGDDGLLEIKCLNARDHVGYLVEFSKNETIETKHMIQAQGQLMVTERKWSDLFLYHPQLPSLTCRVEIDPETHEKLLVGILKVIEVRDQALRILKGEDDE